MSWTLTTRTYPWDKDKSLDELLEAIVVLSELPHVVETITITKTAIKIQVWSEGEMDTVMGSDPPILEDESVGGVLQRIELTEIGGDCDLRLESVARVSNLLIEAKELNRAPTAWVVGSKQTFAAWLGITKPLSRFLDVPVIEHKDVPGDRLVLLCSKSRRQSPLSADVGLSTVMEVEDAEVP